MMKICEQLVENMWWTGPQTIPPLPPPNPHNVKRREAVQVYVHQTCIQCWLYTSALLPSSDMDCSSTACWWSKFAPVLQVAVIRRHNGGKCNSIACPSVEVVITNRTLSDLPPPLNKPLSTNQLDNINCAQYSLGTHHLPTSYLFPRATNIACPPKHPRLHNCPQP